MNLSEYAWLGAVLLLCVFGFNVFIAISLAVIYAALMHSYRD